MKTIRAWTPALLLLAALPRPAAGQVPAGAVEALDRIFAEWDSESTPGCSVGVAREGEIVLERSWGMANLEHGVRSTPATVYEAGSVSKQLTAGAVMLLVLDGKLSLDDDIRTYLPEMPDYGTPITVRHLIHHTSGLRDWGAVASLSGWGRSARTHANAHALEILSRQSALNHAPGDRYSYTNSGFNLLAIIVERVSGKPLAEFSRERIFEPLGMTSTQWRDDYRRIVPGRATAYARAGDGFQISQPHEFAYGNGGLLTTVRDLLTWTESLESGGLAGSAFVDLMHETAPLNDGRPTTYAAGLEVDTYRGLPGYDRPGAGRVHPVDFEGVLHQPIPRVSHTGGTSGYQAFLARYPEQELAVAMLCNVSAVRRDVLGAAVSDVFLGPLSPAPAAAAPAAAGDVGFAARELEGRAGLYRDVDTGQPLRLAIGAGGLRVAGGPRLTPVAPGVLRVGFGERRFTFEARGGSRSRIRATTGRWEDAVYEPVGPFVPSVAELAEYAGDYHSVDAETTLGVAVEDGELVIRRRPGDRFPLVPVYADAFTSALGLVRFHRGGRGQVIELGVGEDRVYDLRFQRGVH